MRNSHTEDLFAGLAHNAALQAITERLKEPGEPQSLRLSGLTLTAKALVASLIYRATGRPQILIADGSKQAEELFSAIAAFCGLLDIAEPPALFPALDVLPGQRMSPHAEILAARAGILGRLSRGEGGIVVMPLAAALWRTNAPRYYRQLTVTLRLREEMPLDELAAHLESTGYERHDPVEMAGEYSIRGGILDVFPPGQDEPLRIEFFGDEVDSIRRFDPATQRSTHKLAECVLQPLTEFQKSNSALAELNEHLREEGLAGVDLPAEGEVFPGWETLLPTVRKREASILDFFEKPVVIIDEPELIASAAERLWARLEAQPDYARAQESMIAWGDFLALTPGHDAIETRLIDLAGTPEVDSDFHLASRPANSHLASRPTNFHLASRPSMAFHGNLQVAIREAKTLLEAGSAVAFFAPTAGEIERLADVFAEYGIACQIDAGAGTLPEHLRERARPSGKPSSGKSAVALIRGAVARGSVFPAENLVIFGAEDLFDAPETGPRPVKLSAGAFSADQFDLKPGDFVVHAEHGIGQFLGVREIVQGEAKGDYMLLEYAGGNKLYVPLTRMDLVQRFRGEGESKPQLDRMGGATWTKTKTRIKKRMRDMAEELLKLYAQRRIAKGFSFSADSNWQREFEDAFEYTETRDQKSAISDIKRDMESEQPMDRLLCGDVGYGKTEVVMRAAFKALGDGKQVAVLAPTTVLCFQHYETFRKRFQSFPVRMEMFSRFRNAKEIKAGLEDLAQGKIDVALGTHRLLSKDVEWKDLGLVIIDEEQRFGVKHKERLKEISAGIDVVTMSATPIPRTLHMSLLGLRDMSVIETPPRDRLAIQTSVSPFAPELVRQAIEMEIARGGQVYFVHNRVDSIWQRAALIQELFPQIRIGVGHGQMPEAELEKVMLGFMRHEYDVLVSTTIVENGLDIPLANTMIIEKAERYGLSELYQLRGRVGRSSRRAYCYLLIDPDSELTEIARKRLAALKEFSELGAGFRIAALDLELRGAGNLLGGEQHGHINAIGFDMYIRMLEEAVRELRGEEVAPEIRTALNLGLDLRIPAAWISDENQRLRAYKRIAQAATEEERAKLADELTDRYGALPEDVRDLMRYAALRTHAEKLGIEAIDRRGPVLSVKFHEKTMVNGEKLMALVANSRGAQFTPAGVLRLPMESAAAPAAVLEFIDTNLVAALS